MKLDRLLPDPGPTTVDRQLAGFEPGAMAGPDRPYTFTNFVSSIDGHATVGGVTGPLGSELDVELLVGLRALADAVLVGAGTVRAERYGRLLADPAKRERRERAGLPPDPLAVIVTAGMELPWDAGLFTSGAGEVLIFTGADSAPPPTATAVEVVRAGDGELDLGVVVGHLRRERGVRGLLCEGGPTLHGELVAAGLVDEIFLTLAPMIGGGEGPRMIEGLAERERGVELRWLLRGGDELYARYALGEAPSGG